MRSPLIETQVFEKSRVFLLTEAITLEIPVCRVVAAHRIKKDLGFVKDGRRLLVHGGTIEEIENLGRVPGQAALVDGDFQRFQIVEATETKRRNRRTRAFQDELLPAGMNRDDVERLPVAAPA